MRPEELVWHKNRHALVREAMRKTYRIGGSAQRYTLLLWGLVRGFPYRRIERQHHIQIRHKPDGSTNDKSLIWLLLRGHVFEHNLPKLAQLKLTYEMVLGEHANYLELEAWLSNPAGAIPAPPPRVRPKKGELWKCGAVRFRVSDVLRPSGEALVFVEHADGTRADGVKSRARIFTPGWERLEEAPAEDLVLRRAKTP